MIKADLQRHIKEMLPKQYIPDWKKLKSSKVEEPFSEASFELIRELGIVTTLLLDITPIDGYPRNEAILIGISTKASKLIKAIVAMTVHLGVDRLLALTRELIEADTILEYLLEDPGTGERFDQYIKNSLVSEREFLKLIRSNVKKRSEMLPIEESMQRSIDRAAKAANITSVESLPSRKDIKWPSIEELINGLNPDGYLAYRAGSTVIHTQWYDILSNHLQKLENGKFLPNLEEPFMRPQPIYGAAVRHIITFEKLLDKLYPELKESFDPYMKTLKDNLWKVYDLHGIFLEEKWGKTINKNNI